MSNAKRSRHIDRTGEKHGRLTVLGRTEDTAKWRVAFLCRCDCGKVVRVRSDQLKNGESKSCGCLKDELQSQRMKGNQNNLVHGLHRHPLYKIWSSMKNRCLNSRSPLFKYYGGRGITVCDRWKESFVNFLADMGERPNTGRRMSIDRIDVNGNYEPSNCRWANYSEQRSNQRRVVVLQAEVDSLRKKIKQLEAVAAPAALA